MVFVERQDGVITGLYANFQEGYAEEELADDDPEVVAFKAPKERGPTVVDNLAALKQALIDKGVITDDEVTTAATTIATNKVNRVV
jgi:hypothetical protein